MQLPPATQDKDVILSYIGQVHAALIDAGRQMDRLAIGVILFATLLLALSLGLVSPDERFKISGLSFKLQVEVILAAMTLLEFVLFLAFWTLLPRRTVLGDEVIRLYRSIGCTDAALDDDRKSPFHNASTLDKFLPTSRTGSRVLDLYDWAAGFVVIFGALFMLPLSAEAVAGIKIADGLDWPAWSVGPLILLSILIPVIQVGRIVAAEETRNA